ncbi:S8 family peptidase [Candidatus Odyssella thessalonicensis]|uniref:S8 family peptidase n=1 Tax=Candidatus Odyssella thessalonicensis TaxID=84647 RepID=UPI000225ABC5|nr:S8 family serine peptidase [Candidatus Odyssella thessalonicensis]
MQKSFGRWLSVYLISSMFCDCGASEITNRDLDRERDFMLVKSEIVNRLGSDYRPNTFHFREADLNMEVRRAEYLYNQQKQHNPYQYPSIGQLFYKKKDLHNYTFVKLRDHEYWVGYARRFMQKYNLSDYDTYPNFGKVKFSERFKEFLEAEALEVEKWKQIDSDVRKNPAAYLLHGPLHPHKITGVDQLHSLGVNGEGAKVIVWDCGFVDNCHVKFSIKDRHVKHPENGQDYSRNDLHGTHVAGTIAGDAQSGKHKGVAYEAEVVPVEFEGVDALIKRIKNSDAKIISASFHYLVHHTEMRDFDKLVEELEKNDRLLVMAAGNDSKFVTNDLNPNFLSYWTRGIWMATHGAWILSKNPALAKRMLLVGSLKEDGQTISRFSNLPGLLHQNFVFAPGENVVATVAFNEFDKMSGTSMATPHVSGILTLMSKYYPQLNAVELKECLIRSCDPFWEDNNHGVDFKPEIFGQGRVNAIRAFKAAEELIARKAPSQTLQDA